MSIDPVRERVFKALDAFAIEIPSWGFANTGTRFGKFQQAAAASTIEEKFADAAEVNRLTGATPTLALHVLWDLPNGLADANKIKALEKKTGVRAGSINPNLFQEQEYKFGSICNPSAEIREKAIAHLLDSVEIGKAVGSAEVSLWIADGSNYPGTQSMRRRIGWVKEALARTHAALAPGQTMLVEYKPFEPAFYHTDIADWGMALELARTAGPQARVLVDTGHHYQSTNIEQIVAWLLELGALGGFHFNDRKYADDDLTLGSIDPYQVFRIFHELLFDQHARKTDSSPGVHDRPEPQPEGQDRGDGADRLDRAGALRQGIADRPRRACQPAGCLQACRGRRALPRRLLAGRASAAARVARPARPARRSAAGAARGRLRGAHHRRAAGKECRRPKFLRLKKVLSWMVC